MTMRGILGRLALGLICATLLSLGCKGAPHQSTVDSGGRSLRDTPEIPYRIGVAVLDRTIQVPDENEELHTTDIQFQLTDLEVQERLVGSMSSYNAASEVVVFEGAAAAAAAAEAPPGDVDGDGDAVNDADSASSVKSNLGRAQEEGLDLLIIPRVRVKAYLRQTKRKFWGSTALWLTTWYGGLVINDRVYDARMSVEFDIYSVSSKEFLYTFRAITTEDALSHTDRNENGGLEGDSGYTVIIPPAFSPDDEEAIGRVLSWHIVDRLAGQLTRYLKEDLELDHEQQLGRVTLIRPQNQKTVEIGKDLVLEGEVLSREAITSVTVKRTGETENYHFLAQASEPKIDTAGAQDTGYEKYSQRFRKVLHPTGPGRMLLRVEFETEAGRSASRTYLLYAPDPNKPQPEEEPIYGQD